MKIKSKNKYFICEGLSEKQDPTAGLCRSGCLWKRVKRKYWRLDLDDDRPKVWIMESREAMCPEVKEVTEEEFILHSI